MHAATHRVTEAIRRAAAVVVRFSLRVEAGFAAVDAHLAAQRGDHGAKSRHLSRMREAERMLAVEHINHVQINHAAR